MIRATALCIALLTVSGPIWAINKCVGPDGKTVFQDAPCAGKGERIEVRPASGSAPVAAPPVATGTTATPPSTTAAATPTKKEGAFGDSWRRKTDLETHLISSARGQLSGHLQGCESQQRQLASKKNRARNNLAGATWEQSISAEMQAAATTCDSKARDLRAQLEGLERELRELQAKQ